MGPGTAGQGPGNKEQVDSKECSSGVLGESGDTKSGNPTAQQTHQGKKQTSQWGGGRDQKRKNEGIGF